MRRLDDIIGSTAGSKGKETRDKDIDSEELNEQVKGKKLENERFFSDTKDRRWLAKWVSCAVSFWLGFVIFILISNELLYICLSDGVLIALLGTTTFNVLGLMYIVLRGHFSKK